MIPEVRDILQALDSGAPVMSHPMSVVHANIGDKTVRFCVDMERDPIQRNNRRGNFYEQSDLETVSKLVPQSGEFIDIGANIGNHSLYFAMFMGARRVIPIEPNPKAFRLLIQNVLVNDLLNRFDLSRLGVGLSDRHMGGYAMEPRDRNLGAAKMLEGEGAIEVHRGDALFADTTPDLIKIDVEGMELKVLDGLSGLFQRCRPILLVEVDNDNEKGFLGWVDRNGYDVEAVVQRYKLNKNYILRPKA